MKIENRTGYTIVMQDGTVYKSLPAVRVDLVSSEVAPCVISVKANGVFNLPPVREGVMLIVTHTVAKYIYREDFLVPGRRDADGRTGWFELPGVPEVRGVGPARGREGSER